MRSGNFSVFCVKNPLSDTLFGLDWIRKSPGSKEHPPSAVSGCFWFSASPNVEASTSVPGLMHRRIGGCWAHWCGSVSIDMDTLQETSMPLQGQGLVPNHQESGAGQRNGRSGVVAPGFVLHRNRECDCGGTPRRSPMDGGRLAELCPAGRRRARWKSREPRLKPRIVTTHQAVNRSREAREDIKVVLRPRKGLVVEDLLGYEIPAAVIDACHRHFDGNSFMLRVHPGSNIIIVSTPHEHGPSTLVHSFVADPEDVLRGVVHGIPPGTSQADLMANLHVRTQGMTTERARMLGSTKTAIITFTGKTLPRCVYFMGAEAVCYPHKPTKQACKVCHSKGHRTDVCPTPDANVCPTCGAREPTQGHECTPKCAICGEDHITGDKLCKKKLKNVPPRKSRAVRTNKPHHPRWYSSDETLQQNYARDQDPGRERLQETEHHLQLGNTTNSRSNSSCSS
ncbi:hypothetical protein HPB50_029430 [Hyalomma asiaticum]|nr:hypothetical protein HPB50_029430 [Hyalomma asiaticum]